MTLDEAYKTLGIHNENVSSDDLREYYNVKLSQVHGFNKEKQIQKIKLAHQMIRNYRCSNNWVGSSSYASSGYTSSGSLYSTLKQPEGKGRLHSILSFVRFALMFCGVIFIFLIICVIFFR